MHLSKGGEGRRAAEGIRKNLYRNVLVHGEAQRLCRSGLFENTKEVSLSCGNCKENSIGSRAIPLSVFKE